MVGWLLLFFSPLLVPSIGAKSAILMDYTSGQVLWAYNAKEKLPPASLTKILSAILVLEKGNLNDTVTVGENPSKVEPSALGLKKGSKISLKDLLVAMLVRSANDAAIAAAEYLAGSQEKFVKLMNEKAKELGATDTHFVNCHGLHHPLHYSTAYDIALITRYALHNPIFASIVSSPTAEVRWKDNEGKEKITRLENTNKLLLTYPYATGVKTGYTLQAGRCLSASARKENWQIICVILNSPNVWEDAVNLLEYTFNNFQPHYIAQKGIPIEYMSFEGSPPRVALLPKDDLLVVSPKDQPPSIKVEKIISKKETPIKAGEKLGVIRVEVNGEYWGETDIIAGNDVSPSLSRLLSSLALKTSLIFCSLLLMLRLWEDRRNKQGFPKDKNR